MLKQLLDLLIAYIEIAFEFIATHLMTIEGIIALIFGMFVLGLISRIRSF